MRLIGWSAMRPMTSASQASVSTPRRAVSVSVWLVGAEPQPYLREGGLSRPDLGYEARFETPLGEQAQVDFARFEVEFADEPGVKRIVLLFLIVLGCSRLIWKALAVIIWNLSASGMKVISATRRLLERAPAPQDAIAP
jgi:hypothetical protein